MKIVINRCYGGFGLSKKATEMYAEKKGITDLGTWQHDAFYTNFYCRDIYRGDPVLIEVVETLGKDANGQHADLRIVEIPDDVNWKIEDYDGCEWVAEVHRTWS